MKKLILVTIVLLLTACGGTNGTTATSAAAADTVNCASGSICPPSQINVISPKTN